MSFGAPHRHYRCTDSTNARARALAAAGAPGGTVVTAEEQTAGRGRQGRAWTAPPGKALLYSAILRPLGDRPLLPLAVALAVCEAAEDLVAACAGTKDLAPPAGCRIKWPNDVWLEGRKLAGVLIEAKTPGQDSARAGGLGPGSIQPRDGWAVIGVGLNLSIARDEFPPELRDRAISILGAPERGRESPRRCLAKRPRQGAPRREAAAGFTAEGGDGHSARRLPTPLTSAAVLSRHLDRWVEAEPQTVLAAYRERDALHGREIVWSAGPDLDAVSGSGVAAGIDDRGGLVVGLPTGGRTVLFAGEVHLRL